MNVFALPMKISRDWGKGSNERLNRHTARGEERWSGRGRVKKSGSRCNKYDHSWVVWLLGFVGLQLAGGRDDNAQKGLDMTASSIAI
jgi:hypothetical protein